MSEWQPIETLADNVQALLYQAGCEIIAGSIEHWTDATGSRGGCWVHPAEVGGYEWECSVERPTHWMPLPDPPA